jgi:2-phospho-L-lactate guanylyltransferase
MSDALDDRSRMALARAMALDTIAAATACAAVGLVLVVTSDEVVAREAAEAARAAVRGAQAAVLRGGADAGSERPGGAGGSSESPAGAAVQILPEPTHVAARSGLDAAAAAGVEHARHLVPGAPVAVLLGDLPALRPADLGAALVLAGTHGRAMVADEPGTGTTLLTVSGTATFDSRFGAGSAQAHRELGYAPLDVPVASTLRRDIDLPADLGTLLTVRPGPRTARLIDRLLPATDRAVGGEPSA